jgi:hypothetical protein
LCQSSLSFETMHALPVKYFIWRNIFQAFTISCLTLHTMSLKPADMDHIWLLSVTFVGMLIVELGSAFAELLKDPLPSHVVKHYYTL